MDMQQHLIEEEELQKELKGTIHQRFCEPGNASPYNIVRLLNICTTAKDIHEGSKLHEYVREHNYLARSTYIGSTLISMYAKCGALAKAHQVLKELPMRDVVSWTALIAGYAQHGQGEEALKCFDDMLRDKHSPNAITFICVLKACASMGAAAKGEKIHDKSASLGMLEKDVVLGTTLVDMYAKCGALSKAHRVLKELPICNVASWNALIAGYAQHGQGEKALKCLDDMLYEGQSPDAVTFICILKACGSIGAAAKGEEIHAKMVSLSLPKKDLVLGNSLVDMYAKCGELDKAQHVLRELPMRDVISWNALIAGYAQHEQGEKALKCFHDMPHDGHSPNAVTFICVLKACGSIGTAATGEHIHDKIVSLGMLEKDTVLGTTLVDMYAKCGALAKAYQVLKELPRCDVVSWTALIAGYAQHKQGKESLKCFDDMLQDGHSPNAVTFICVLKACGSIRAVVKGEEIHNKIISLGMLEKKNVVLGTTLVDMYAKCGALAKAHRVLKELPMRNVVSWNALIAGYAKHGQGVEALKCFDDMLCDSYPPNESTFICVLKACGSIGAAAKGEEIHDMVVSLGMLEKNVLLGTTLVDMYAKCGELARVQGVLKELPVCEVVSWRAVTAGYTQFGQGQKALKCFDGHFPNTFTFICALKACWSIRAGTKAEETHEKIGTLGMLQKDVLLGNTLVDVYVKCGGLSKAQQVLEKFTIHDVVCWNVLISGYAQQGQSLEAINCFKQMQSNRVKPDLISLTIVLNACSHAGLLDQAEAYFSGMCEKFGIHPGLDHYCCMIDVFGRAGKFNKALSVIAEMPNDNCLSSWGALLGACRKWTEVKIGTLAFKCALNLGKGNAAIYVVMSDIYTAAGMKEEAHAVEMMKVTNKAWNKPGCCWWTNATGEVHTLLFKDIKHAQNEHIYAKLKGLANKMLLLGDFQGECKKDVLCAL